MKIKTIDIQNFRKLKCCRIDTSDKGTIFVGANNSGKTSAMFALLKFLKTKTNFSINDITVTNWSEIEKIGKEILKKDKFTDEELRDLIKQFRKIMPSLDIWLNVENDESHHVINLIPTLEWDGGLLGVRTTLEIKSIDDFIKDYRENSNKSKQVLDEYKAKNKKSESSLELWPKNMYDFLSKKLNNHFKLNSYILDPEKYEGIQELSDDSITLDSDPFKGLIKIDSIGAQRGFSDDEDKTDKLDKMILSNQFTNYYNNHINPQENPDVADIAAIEAIREAEDTFDLKLKDGFRNAVEELQTLGYPGFNDPKITIETKIRPIDSLNHGSSVRFDVAKGDTKIPKLPERYNGLGYQNLISIVFQLIRFRDEWMKVGKIAKRTENNNSETIPPLHLVLIEEPEAHLHSQVQQVFIRKAYEVLRNHDDLEKNSTYNTHMIVSTHSSHIAHEVDFSNLRYFKKEGSDKNTISTTKVINLSGVFDTNKKKCNEKETARFIKRYLKTTHCDIFFADAVIFIEGNVERILLPHFIENKYPQLNGSYISILEIGGRHSHRLRPLIETLGIITLIITDLDTVSPKGRHPKRNPKRNNNLLTGNYTLKSWVPMEDKIDVLVDMVHKDKILNENEIKVCVAYQIPIWVTINKSKYEVMSNTFEDAFVVSNLNLFMKKSLDGTLKTFKKCVEDCETGDELQISLYNTLDKFNRKAEFALDLLYQIDPNEYSIPNYIAEGLDWLSAELGNQNIFAKKGEDSHDK